MITARLRVTPRLVDAGSAAGAAGVDPKRAKRNGTFVTFSFELVATDAVSCSLARRARHNACTTRFSACKAMTPVAGSAPLFREHGTRACENGGATLRSPGLTVTDSVLHTFQVRTRSREELVDITSDVAALVSAHGGHGIATVFVPHTSAAVTINENADRDVQRDMLFWLKKLIPESGEFRHAEGNSDAHIKASLVGNSVTVPFVDGRMRLGTWQGIYFCEFDGPRARRAEVMLR